MKRIASFEVNHHILQPGMYTSRVDGDVITYDIRMVRPNGGAYLENGQMHTFEHLFATYVRNSPWSDSIVYVGPMGCCTGFYFLTRDDVPPARAISLVQETAAFVAGYEGEIPGASTAECGNAAEHSLPKAKELGARLGEILKDWTEERLAYEK